MKKLLTLALIVGGAAAVAKLASAQKAEWEGLTEPEVRSKLDAHLPDKIPGDKRADIADKVVGKMREKGALRDETEQPMGETSTP